MNILNIYNEIINILMRNDKNAIWDEILEEMKENYDEESDIIKYSLEKLVGASETALESCDKEALEFYKKQYEKVIELLKAIRV